MRPYLAKILVSVGSFSYGVVPVIADFNESHLLKPDWMPHAKFPLPWLLVQVPV